MIEIQILDPQLQTLTDPHARSIQKLGEQTML
ncbi:intI1 domain protein, partial [Acinetobacter baumannii 942133]